MSDEMIGDGGESLDSSVETTSSAGTEGAAGATSPVSVADDTLITHPKLNGGKPIKYSEAFKGFQSEFTKASQKAAALERTLAERNARLAALERDANAARATGSNATSEALRQLSEAPYVTGAQLANILVGTANALKQRDEQVGKLLQVVGALRGHVESLVGASTSSAFDGRIAGWLKDAGIPADAAEWAKEVYLAYEPSAELDSEFPGILNTRWKQLNGLFETGRKAQLANARRTPWVPGKGGNTGPSAPQKMSGKESPKDVANQVWEAMLGPGVET